MTEFNVGDQVRFVGDDERVQDVTGVVTEVNPHGVQGAVKVSVEIPELPDVEAINGMSDEFELIESDDADAREPQIGDVVRINAAGASWSELDEGYEGTITSISGNYFVVDESDLFDADEFEVIKEVEPVGAEITEPVANEPADDSFDDFMQELIKQMEELERESQAKINGAAVRLLDRFENVIAEVKATPGKERFGEAVERLGAGMALLLVAVELDSPGSSDRLAARLTGEW